MLNKIHQFATARNLLIVWILYFIMAGGVMSTMAKKMEAIAGPIGPIDLVIPTYSPQTAHDMIAAYGAEGRALYRTIELTADVVYPIIYGLAFALLLAFLWTNISPKNVWARQLPLLAFLAVLFDLLENAAIVTLLSVYPAQPDSVALMAGFFSLMKWGLVFANLIGIVVGLIIYLSMLFRRRKQQVI